MTINDGKFHPSHMARKVAPLDSIVKRGCHSSAFSQPSPDDLKVAANLKYAVEKFSADKLERKRRNMRWHI